MRFNEALIRDGILYEMQRGGQVYFIHNRVENIQEVAGMLQRLIPDARIRIGHGQMDGEEARKKPLGVYGGEIRHPNCDDHHRKRLGRSQCQHHLHQ